MQENWIGRSKGLKFRFHFAGQAPSAAPDGLDVYTTRPDTLYGASFVGVAADHPLDLEHLGTEISKDRASKWPRKHLT